MLSQIKYFRQRMIKYLEKHTVRETAIHFKVSRKTVYKWKNRYDGTINSLEDKSHRPHNIPRAHSEQELKLIKRLAKKHKWNDLILVYQELKERYNYNKSYGGLKRVISRMKTEKLKKKLKKKCRPYKRADYIGQKYS